MSPTPSRSSAASRTGASFLSGRASCEELLKKVNLHVVVRLTNGVFAPYTGIPTNHLFFDRSGPTKQVWYYEQLLPEGRINYTKTQPIQFDDFAPLVAWWAKREESERAWKVGAKKVLASGCNLDRKDANVKQDVAHLPLEGFVASILEKEKQIIEILGRIQDLLARKD